MAKDTQPPAKDDNDDLIKKVDAMMDAKAPDATPVAKPKPVPEPPKPAAATAPEVPPETLKTLAKPSAVSLAGPYKPAKAAKTPDSAHPLAPIPLDDDTAADEPTPLLKTDEHADIESPKTDQAVAKIVAEEGDKLLEVEDAAKKPALKPAAGKGWKQKLKNLGKKKLAAIIIVLALLIVGGVPYIRYAALGLVLKKSVTVTVIDSKTSTPVSNAEVKLHGVVVKTDGDGKATIKAPVGGAKLDVSKAYYGSLTAAYFVGLGANPQRTVHLQATGRQVPVTVLNSITGQPVQGATVKVLSTTAKTNAKGLATIVLPVKLDKQPGAINFEGFNTANVTVSVTDKPVAGNTFKVTPSGHVYFLSNSAGTIDVVKSNLDGTGRKTVFEGTGKEDARTTSLLASRDWKYVVLKARHDTTQPGLYTIDTTTDKVVPFESGNNDSELVGWHGHNFIYSLTRSGDGNLQQPSRQILKSYDAEHQQPNQLDQSQAEGDADTYGYQGFSNFYILDNLVVYSTQWYGHGKYDLAAKTATIRAVQPGGQNKKDYQTFPAGTTSYISARLYEPQSLYFSLTNTSYKTSYYHFENQTASEDTSLTGETFDKAYPTFLLSPSGNQTFWSEVRDGKNTLFTGDTKAEKPKQIATLSDYTPYGWYGESYVLVSKGASELYILPATGLKAGQTALKVTDYYKPAQTYAGYGYGYGGL